MRTDDDRPNSPSSALTPSGAERAARSPRTYAVRPIASRIGLTEIKSRQPLGPAPAASRRGWDTETALGKKAADASARMSQRGHCQVGMAPPLIPPPYDSHSMPDGNSGREAGLPGGSGS